MAQDQTENEIRKYKRYTTSYDGLENTQAARQSYLNYEREKELPTDCEAETEWIETIKKLHMAMGRLTFRQREVLIMIAVQGFNETEVAVKLGISQAAVSQFYSAAKSKMRKALDS